MKNCLHILELHVLFQLHMHSFPLALGLQELLALINKYRKYQGAGKLREYQLMLHHLKSESI